jgi:serine/threonine protein kinase
VNTHDEELLAELLIQWEELYERGQDSSPQELCRDCPHLIKELERRIAAMKATNWLNDPDCPADAPATASHQAQGKVLGGRYRLDDLIATGGFAEVWRAFDTELQRIVAIKLPKPSRLASATNFMTEARRVARLKHPGIVPVFDVGTEGSSCFIVSEYVEGGSLGDRLTKSPPTLEETTRWLSEIAAALEYAHLHGVIHRDIKPANILIDHHGRALLADFGIAQSAQKSGTFAPSLGTLRYMSPEQLEGKAATPQSDVYSLGVVLHESLTGRVPYSSSEPSVLRHEIVGGAKQLSRDVPVALLDVCKKAMQRLPHERHTSAAHFATDLERAVAQASPRRRWKTPLLWIAVFGPGSCLPKNPTPNQSEQPSPL